MLEHFKKQWSKSNSKNLAGNKKNLIWGQEINHSNIIFSLKIKPTFKRKYWNYFIKYLYSYIEHAGYKIRIYQKEDYILVKWSDLTATNQGTRRSGKDHYMIFTLIMEHIDLVCDFVVFLQVELQDIEQQFSILLRNAMQICNPNEWVHVGLIFGFKDLKKATMFKLMVP